jgi:hypothetical protein
MSDSSPQGSRDWFVTRVEIWSRKDGWWAMRYARGDPEARSVDIYIMLSEHHMLVPVVLGSGRTTLAAKFFALIHQLKLDFGATVPTIL